MDLKCIESKCSRYFNSDYYHWCYITETNVRPGEDCLIIDVILKDEVFLANLKVLKESIKDKQKEVIHIDINNCCVCCRGYIVEGRQVCWKCENGN